MFVSFARKYRKNWSLAERYHPSTIFLWREQDDYEEVEKSQPVSLYLVLLKKEHAPRRPARKSVKI